MSFTVLFIAHAPDADPEKHRSEIVTGQYRLISVVVRIKPKPLMRRSIWLRAKTSTRSCFVRDLPTPMLPRSSESSGERSVWLLHAETGQATSAPRWQERVRAIIDIRKAPTL